MKWRLHQEQSLSCIVQELTTTVLPGKVPHIAMGFIPSRTVWAVRARMLRGKSKLDLLRRTGLFGKKKASMLIPLMFGTRELSWTLKITDHRHSVVNGTRKLGKAGLQKVQYVILFGVSVILGLQPRDKAAMLVVNTKEILLPNLHQNRVHFPAERDPFVLDYQHGRRDVTCKPAICKGGYATRILLF